MAQKLTVEDVVDDIPIGLNPTMTFHDQVDAIKADLVCWFNWLRDRFVDEVRAEIDPLVARAKRERDAVQRELEKLRAELQSSRRLLNAANETIALRDEIVDGLSDITTALQGERDEVRCERDALAARVKELEAATAKPAPKPRHTGGQKVRDWLENHVGHLDHRINDEAFEAFAKEHGIPDDPEPPSDAELMRRASETSDSSTSAYWSQCAAEFLRLRAERDGGEA